MLPETHSILGKMIKIKENLTRKVKEEQASLPEKQNLQARASKERRKKRKTLRLKSKKAKQNEETSRLNEIKKRIEAADDH
jgi:hypothetical protein